MRKREGHADLALLKQHSGHDLVEQADQAKHGVVWQVLLRKLPLHSSMHTSFTVLAFQAFITTQVPGVSLGFLPLNFLYNSRPAVSASAQACLAGEPPADGPHSFSGRVRSWCRADLSADLAGVAGIGLAQHRVAEAGDDAAAVQGVPNKLLHLLLAGRLPNLGTAVK